MAEISNEETVGSINADSSVENDVGYVENDSQEISGLRSHYDAIVLGTGLTESILACAISRTGRYVLHLDPNDFYGRNESSHSLESFIAIAQAHMTRPLEDGPEGSSISNTHQSIQFEQKKLPVFRTLYFQDFTTFISTMQGQVLEDMTESSSSESTASSKVNDIHKLYPFNIDFPGNGLLLGSGIVVDSLIKSDVSKYLEFQSMEGLYVYRFMDVSPDTFFATPVPRSRGEVFKSDLFNVLEKRSLMKFLQMVSDWGRERDGIQAHQLNEIDLATGRSLHRPQNKDANVSADLNLDDYADVPFHRLLDDCHLSPKLQETISCALCLYSRPIRTSSEYRAVTSYEGLKDLYAHLVSLGRFGEGAFLTPIYGIGDISQAFCRMCAVWAGIYVLRCGVLDLSIPSIAELTAIEPVEADIEDEVVVRKASNIRNISVRDTNGLRYTCEKFICSKDDWPSQTRSKAFILTYTGILDNPVLPTNRSVAVIPPNTGSICNQNNIFVIQKDSSTQTVPSGYYSVTIVTEVDGEDDHAHVSLMKNVIEYVKKTVRNCPDPSELYAAVTLRPLFSDADMFPRNDNPKMQSILDHVALCGQTSCSIAMTSHIVQAEAIFRKFYPNEDFLAAFKNVDNGDYDGNNDDVNEEYDFSRLEVALAAMEERGQTEDNTVIGSSIPLSNVDAGDDSSESSDDVSPL